MPLPMVKISLNAPAYTNDDFSGSFPASNADNSVYGGSNWWRCATTPVGNANSGTLTQPVYLAYDLSGVNVNTRRQVILVWYNDTPGTGAYDPNLIANPYINMPNAYTIDVNAAVGGSLPGSGWITKVTVTNNTYHSRQHVLDMTGYNWIRMNATAAIGSASNNNIAINMDVHDAHLTTQDSWIFYGDSITQRGLDHDDTAGIGNILPAQINASKPQFFPIWECAGIGGYTATDMQAIMAGTFLPMFPGQYVALPLGTNDANGGGALVTNFQSKMQSMVTSILAAGKTPIIPHIPYGKTANIIANGPTINTAIDTLVSSNPGTLAGPDLWAYFQANQTLIDVDNIHMTDPAGYAAYRTQWLNWATANIYNLKNMQTSVQSAYKVRTVLNTDTRTAFKVRTVLKTLMRTHFLIKLTGAGPKPYMVTGVSTKMIARPFSTISSQATVIDSANTPQDTLTASVSVLFPDNSTTSPQVYWLGTGTGLYSTTYNTKGAGAITETWTFTDSAGSTIEHQHKVTCYFGE